MPGVFRLSVDLAVKEVERAAKLGIPAIATFPNVDQRLRDQTGSAILDPDDLLNRATRAFKACRAGNRRHHRRRPRSVHQPRP